MNAEAAAEELVETMQQFAKDVCNGEDAWAYAGALTARHQMNQQAMFSGDVLMQGMLKNMK
jgi:hypothetical protein